jgi:uncharacterized radical SAM superfamily Fe-S cluster-containing enzyme
LRTRDDADEIVTNERAKGFKHIGVTGDGWKSAPNRATPDRY